MSKYWKEYKLNRQIRFDKARNVWVARFIKIMIIEEANMPKEAVEKLNYAINTAKNPQ